MSTRKKIPTNLLDKIEPADRALFLELWLTSDKCGIVPNTYPLDRLQGLHESELIKVTKDVIVLLDYLSANYGTIKKDHNPHKAALSCIESNGFVFDYENQIIDIPLSRQITDFSVLSIDQNDQSRVSGGAQGYKAVEPLKTSQNKIANFLSSTSYALILSILLMCTQSIHTAYALLSLSSLPDLYNKIFAIVSAVLLDSLILFYISQGDIKNSRIALFFCASMNLYSYTMHGVDFLTYQFFFMLLAACYLPYAVHGVSMKISIVENNIK